MPAPVPQHTSSPWPNGPSSASAAAVTSRMLCGVRKHRAITYEPHAACEPIEWTATADEIIEKVRYVTARMEQLVNAVQIGDVMDKAA
jgi:hypothetical protein